MDKLALLKKWAGPVQPVDYWSGWVVRKDELLDFLFRENRNPEEIWETIVFGQSDTRPKTIGEITLRQEKTGETF